MCEEAIRNINDLLMALQDELKDIPKDASVLQNIVLGRIDILQTLKGRLYIEGIK